MHLSIAKLFRFLGELRIWAKNVIFQAHHKPNVGQMLAHASRICRIVHSAVQYETPKQVQLLNPLMQNKKVKLRK